MICGKKLSCMRTVTEVRWSVGPSITWTSCFVPYHGYRFPSESLTISYLPKTISGNSQLVLYKKIQLTFLDNTLVTRHNKSHEKRGPRIRNGSLPCQPKGVPSNVHENADSVGCGSSTTAVVQRGRAFFSSEFGYRTFKYMCHTRCVCCNYNNIIITVTITLGLYTSFTWEAIVAQLLQKIKPMDDILMKMSCVASIGGNQKCKSGSMVSQIN